MAQLESNDVLEAPQMDTEGQSAQTATPSAIPYKKPLEATTFPTSFTDRISGKDNIPAPGEVNQQGGTAGDYFNETAGASLYNWMKQSDYTEDYDFMLGQMDTNADAIFSEAVGEKVQLTPSEQDYLKGANNAENLQDRLERLKDTVPARIRMGHGSAVGGFVYGIGASLVDPITMASCLQVVAQSQPLAVRWH